MQQSNYKAFLLRLWRDDEGAPWRAGLENPHSGERNVFGSLAELVEFLKEQTGAEPGNGRAKGSETPQPSQNK